MAISRPFVDQSGDMYLHPEGGGVAVYCFQMDNGTDRDMSASQVFFQVGTFRKQLTPGETSNALVLTILPGELNSLQGKKSNFILIDETNTPHLVILEGSIFVSKWTT